MLMKKENGTLSRMAAFLDTEWFLYKDTLDAAAEERNRSIAASMPSFVADDARWEIWLAARRRLFGEDANRLLPGRMVTGVIKTLSRLLCIIFFVVGWLTAFAALQYNGRLPVNLLHAVSALVGIPFFTLLVTAFALFRGKRGDAHWVPLGYQALFYLVKKGLTTLMARAQGGMFRDILEDTVFWKGLGKTLRNRYRKMVFWVGFALFQVAGVGFVLGILSGVLAKAAGSDLAFGWQTSISVSAERLHHLITTLAFPWKSFFPETIPSVTAVAGSRILLKDGLAAMDPVHLVSWWPYLFMMVLVYAVLPRLLLLGFGIYKRKQAVSGVSLQDSRIHHLLHLLREGERKEKRGNLAQGCAIPEAEKKNRLWELWIPDEVAPAIHGGIIKEVETEMGFPPRGVFIVDFTKTLPDQSCETLVLVTEVWDPPIRERLQILQHLAANRKGPLWLYPVGMVSDKEMMTPDPVMIRIWEKALSGLSEPRPLLLKETAQGDNL